MTSITFPAIGTGNTGFPKDLVARIFLSEIHAFSAKVSPQSLNEVTVIVHPSDTETVQVLENVGHLFMIWLLHVWFIIITFLSC